MEEVGKDMKDAAANTVGIVGKAAKGSTQLAKTTVDSSLQAADQITESALKATGDIGAAGVDATGRITKSGLDAAATVGEEGAKVASTAAKSVSGTANTIYKTASRITEVAAAKGDAIAAKSIARDEAKAKALKEPKNITKMQEVASKEQELEITKQKYEAEQSELRAKAENETKLIDDEIKAVKSKVQKTGELTKAQNNALMKAAEAKSEVLNAQKNAELIEKEAACEASIYNGEYTVEWFFGNVNNNQKLEYQGSESLVLSNCTGKFDGEKDFQPTKELRKKLKVNYQPNGTIHVAGRLDLFEKGDMEGEIELKGDINIGEASGKTRAGDLIKIVIVKKAQRSTLFDGQYTFNLFRFSDEDSMKLGSGGITIKDGKLIINNDGRLLKTGSEDLYDSLEAQINKNGVVSGSIEIDILGKQQRTENYDLEGIFNDKIWGSSPDEEYFKIYFIFK